MESPFVDGSGCTSGHLTVMQAILECMCSNDFQRTAIWREATFKVLLPVSHLTAFCA